MDEQLYSIQLLISLISSFSGAKANDLLSSAVRKFNIEKAFIFYRHLNCLPFNAFYWCHIFDAMIKTWGLCPKIHGKNLYTKLTCLLFPFFKTRWGRIEKKKKVKVKEEDKLLSDNTLGSHSFYMLQLFFFISRRECLLFNKIKC